MTLKEIMELSLRLMMEDVDTETLAEFSPLLKGVINDAYIDICRFKYVPIKSEAVVLSDGAFNTPNLSETLNNIVTIKSGDKELLYYVEDGVCSVLTKENESVTVRYSYVPQVLVADTDSPIFAQEYHSCLADYAVYRVLGTGSGARQARALFFFDTYVRQANKIERMQHSEPIKNKYE